MAVKGKKKVYPVCELARWGLGYNNAASTAQPAQRGWSAFNAPWQGELPPQEAMLLLSLHLIFQHYLPNFQNQVWFLFLLITTATGGSVDITHQQTYWWSSAGDLGNEHAHSQAPNSSGLETSGIQILLYL